jgi:hypothetical protein
MLPPKPLTHCNMTIKSSYAVFLLSGLILLNGNAANDLNPSPVMVTNVTFSQGTSLTNDDESAMGSPHWIDEKSDIDPKDFPDGSVDPELGKPKPNNMKSYAYSYVSNKKPMVEAVFKWKNSPPPEGSPYSAEGKVVDTPNCEFKLERKQLSGDVTYPATVADQNIVKERLIQAYVTANRKVDRSGGPANLVPVTIEWTVFDKNSNEVGKSQSTHTIYVTWDEPATALRQETLLNLSCVMANGVKADSVAEKNSVTDKIYGEFQDLEIKRMDGEVLGYYRGPTDLVEVYQILKINKIAVNGQCACFAELFQESLAINRVASTRYSVKSNFGGSSPGLLVKNWTFSNGSLPGPWTHRFESEVSPLPDGIQGQGKINPIKKLFSQHFVVVRSGRIFDPSYGTGPFTGSNTNWEFASLHGYVCKNILPINATEYELILAARIEEEVNLGTVFTQNQ